MEIPAQRCMLHPDDKNVMKTIEDILFNTGNMTFGDCVEAFEQYWADECKTKYCVSLNSCTSALEIALRALNIPEHKYVAIPTNTYGATLQAVWNAGLQPRLIDIQPDLMLYEDAIRWDEIGAVIFVGIGGNIPPRIERIEHMCKWNNIPLIIDAAHCHGVPEATEYGDVQCFSFFATKLITTGGEGGALTTNNKDVDEFARLYRRCGKKMTGETTWKHVSRGGKYSMTEIQAAIGMYQIQRLHEYIENRRKIAKVYMEKFFERMIVKSWTNFYKFMVRGRPDIKVKDITLPSPAYSIPLHKQPIWEWETDRFHMADKHCPNHFCLPIYNHSMTDEEIKYVMDNVDVKD